MAKITVVGEAIVITSTLKREDIEKVAKYRKNALVLKGGEDGKEPIFKIGLTKSNAGSINQYGAEFGGETHDDAKLATITLAAPGLGENARDEVAELVGAAILNLNKLEETIPAVLEEINAERDRVLENIVVM